MAYFRHKPLPSLGERINLENEETEDDILAASGSNYTVLVANVVEGSLEHLNYKDKSYDWRFASVVLENITGFEKPMSLERPLWPDLNYLESQTPFAYRVVCLVYEGSRVVPIKIVKSAYTVLQNRFVVRDAIQFVKTSRGSANVVSAGPHNLGKVFSVQLTFKVLDIPVGDKVHRFSQHATFFTSHDSSQTYGLAFGRIGEKDNFYSSWNTLKIKHTPKMQDHRNKVKNFLEGCEEASKSFIEEVSLMGKMDLNPNSTEYEQLLNQIVVSDSENSKFGYDRRTWESKKITEYFLEAAKIYGYNAWSLYVALNEFSFRHVYKSDSDDPVLSLRDKQFELQNKLKHLLLPAHLLMSGKPHLI